MRATTTRSSTSSARPVSTSSTPPRRSRKKCGRPCIMAEFRYEPSKYVPFRDVEAIKRCRAIKREDIDKHPNPQFRIRVVKDADVPFIFVADMVGRITRAADEGRPLVMILPNPVPLYRQIARVLNNMRQDC